MDLRLFICFIFLPSLRISRGQIVGCPKDQWQCDDGSCITNAWRCDGEGDCLDGSDEMDCGAPTGSDCPPDQFPCLDTVGCVDASARCDGQIQCPTGSDEENCPGTEGCQDSDWMCKNHICIRKELRCNRQNDCMDNSDEEDCGLCNKNGVRCPEGTCLPAEERCDGQIHCSDGSDEPITCSRLCSMNNGGCSHTCTDEPWGVLCTCPVGYKLAPNGAVCEDVNECELPFAPCVHHCTNTIGSYFCHCKEGFKLDGSSTCLASGNTTRLLIVQRSAVGLLSVKSQQFDSIATSVFDPVALAFDIARGWLYWADSQGNIYKSNGRYSWTAFVGEPGIRALACDWLNGYLFWTNQKMESIYMQAVDGKMYTTLLNKNIRPSELVLLPVESMMIWINEGSGDRMTIEKSWMDGSDRGTLTVITAQSAHSLTADVAARRLYWISDFKKSVETVKVDGTGRYSFKGLFNKRPALSLAVFESVFYWIDAKGLWQVPQNNPTQRKFTWKTEFPLLSVYHELQQPQGSSACLKSPCSFCQLTKSDPRGFTCACPHFKVMMPDGTCRYPRFIYATGATINLLEFRGRESTEIQLFATDDGVLSFDVDWNRDWLYWTNQTGHIQRTGLTQVKTEVIPTPLPVCLINVDQRSGNLYWVTCDENSIGTTTVGKNYPQRLYHTTKEIRGLYLDWLRGGVFWLEEEKIFSMDILGGKSTELLQIAGGVRGNMAFDIRASSLLWNSKRGDLTTLSLLQERSHQAGRRWNISGSIVAAFEPYLLSISDDVMTLWDRRDGSPIQDVTVRGRLICVIAALGDAQTVPDTPVCSLPSLLCRHSSVCLPQAQLCDGKKDCPDGDDEESCVVSCPSKEDFKCKDHSSCIPRSLICDGRSHCRDGSDEVDCPTVASPVSQENILKCRSGSKPCADGSECVLYSHVCDGEEDCTDGSDELGCDVPQETSSTKQNVDPSNEMPPAQTPTACSNPSVLCPSSVRLCISPSQYCDGVKDCPDGFDEKSCIKSCPSKNEFRCKDRRSCVSKGQVCDGRFDCFDGSDEVGCPSVATRAPQKDKMKCRFGSRLCQDETGCVLLSHVCDGDVDCQDGSDEAGCDYSESAPNVPVKNGQLNESPALIQPFTQPPTKPPCTSPSVQCPGSSLCIKPFQMCDGRRDCPDGSDEKCVKRCLSDTDFRCKDRRSCVSKSQICDGRSDCQDGSDEVGCPSVAARAPQKDKMKCRFGSRLCQDGTGCVLLSHVCDGERDCQDGSDEEGCDATESTPRVPVKNEQSSQPPAPVEAFTQPPTKPPCTSPSVQCPGSSLCIKPTQMCDGRRDCPDGSDEKCVKRCPSDADFRCKDRRSCVSKTQICDGRSDCQDGSDEVGCPSVSARVPQKDKMKCRFGSNLCQDGTGCVLLSHVCDGERDCQDGSDEEGCDIQEGTKIVPTISAENENMNESPALIQPFNQLPTKPPCTSPSVQCPGSSLCIKPTQMCDGRRDCPDGSDEKCVKRCPSDTDFRCKDRRSCVSKSQICDGRSDCHDGSDEVGCPSVAARAPQKDKMKCRFGSNLCQDGTGCVLLSHVCDGERDCQDGSDEEGCDGAKIAPTISTENENMNESPALIQPFTQLPTKPPCTSPSVQCPGSSLCIKPTQMCDGKRDCPDGSDEKCVKRCPSDTDFRCKDRRSCVSKTQICDGRSDCQDGSDEVGCPSVTARAPQKDKMKCRFGSRLCQDGTGCILLSHVCDGERDCQDGSDEEGCDIPEGTEIVPTISTENENMNESPALIQPFTQLPTKPPCTSPSVQCPGSSLCIKPTQMCDGRRDCPDGSDEKCVKRCPSDTDFRCKDRRSCVSKSQICDGRSDCQDGSDEVGCPSVSARAPQKDKMKCRFGSNLCQDGTGCVLLSHVCDGERDCQDGSDEEGCDDAKSAPTISVENDNMNESPALIQPYTPTKPLCTSPSVQCPGSSLCIKPTQMCDGRRDCPDGSDEKCVKRCPSDTDFRCKDRRSCVSRIQICDGRSHCHDGSDEVGCPGAALPATPTNPLKCLFGSRPCQDGTGCVLLSHVCDGETDCQDGSDEEGCGDLLKDGVNSDTTIVPTKPPCTSPSVQCPGSTLCIKPTQMCDGRRDCPDGSDEKCVKRCPSDTDLRCKDRRSCVSKNQICDGRSDCHDGSDEVGCPSVSARAPQKDKMKCRFGSNLCQDGTGCVLLSHVCDGERDCQDGSDEEGCDGAKIAPTISTENENMNESPALIQPFTQLPTKPPCTSPSVQCPGSSLCIKPTQMCDGRRDCPDGSDEKCVKRCPSDTDFRCKDRRSCVSKTQVCDGRSDCHDGSDEVGCPSVPLSGVQTKVPKCLMGSWPCQDGTECIIFRHVCDGERDCQDGSDEEGCDAAQMTKDPLSSNKPSCTFPSVQCPESDVCVTPAQFCDGKRDCPDGSDENCLKKCFDRTDFLCKDRRSCIPNKLVCDGRSHCHDGSDEVNCPSVNTPAPQANVLKCRMGSKLCNDGKECVLHSHICDGEKDCMDGSDEEGCQETCKQGEFQCSHGKMCIPEAEVCDGKYQCRDQSDELDCWEQTKSCEYRCADGKRCIPKKFLCDGERDCLDGTDELGCDSNPAATESPLFPSTPACATPSVLCPGFSLCVSQNQLCDGQKDCPDGFDENDCVFQCENPGDFLCNDKRKCVPSMHVCDGRAHCPDGSDEKQCQSSATSISNVPNPRSGPLRCLKGFKPCKDGLDCVMYSHVCDGEKDCKDGSDEEGCRSRCKAGEFQCAHGNRCIPQELVCDGQNDCQDQSDEMDCLSQIEGCHQRCDNNTRCIPKTFLCDGERDCVDGSDEEKCGLVACGFRQFRCASGQCVSEAMRCDGYPDCSDRSDEVDCRRPLRCPFELRCPHSHECLQKDWLCDGEEDCKDGSDEKNCITTPIDCRAYQWQCGDGRWCIPLSWRCDGKDDCHDGKDEDKCSQRKCPSHLYQCGSGECLDTSLVCNGRINCADTSDEGVGCSQRNCSSPSARQCDHHCVSTPNGPRCYCTAGFMPQPITESCVDIDECNSAADPVCKHLCVNAPGSYSCRCHSGFYLEPDNKSCKTKDEPLLLASVQSELLLLRVHSGTLELFSSIDKPVSSLDYHWAQQRVYWLSPDYQSIRWADMTNDMTNANKGTLIKGVKTNSIAIDWVGGNLYWLDGLVGQILVVKLSNFTVRSEDSTVVLGDNLQQPNSLVLLPDKGLMLWSETGSTPQIERSGMDGSKRKVVVSQDLSWPVSLAYDLLGNRVYWADEKLHCIGSASLEGDDIKILQLAETPSPISVAVFNDRVFWSDSKRRTVRSADKKTGKNQKVLLKRPGQPFGLKLMHALSQPAVSNPCESLRCSHLCLLAPGGGGKSGAGSPSAPAAVCRCPIGLLLSQDKITCSLPKESSFILLLSHDMVYQIYLRSMSRDGVGLEKMPNGRDFALPGSEEPLGLDLSIPELSLFVADSRRGSVDMLRLSSSGSQPGLALAGQILKLKDDSVTALAVDWVTSNLYWSSNKRPDIHVTSRYNGHTTSLQQGSLTGTTSIALHPPSGRLCYIAVVMIGRNSQMEVDCAWMNGWNKVVVWSKSSVPVSLVFSNTGTVIYWADTAEGVIASVGVDGSGYKRFKSGPGLLVSLAYIENIFLWTTLDKDATKLWFSDGLLPRQLWFETKTKVLDIRAYNDDSQSGTNGCSINNGLCDQLCLPNPEGRTCKCGRGFYNINATSCSPLPSCPPGKESCSDGIQCISSTKFCDGRADCPDKSDEQDCQNSNSASPRTKIGDGRSLQSPSSHPNKQKNSGLSDKNSASCDSKHCSGHGTCVTEGQLTHCQCVAGYKGEFCQEQDRQSHPAVILGSFTLVTGVIVAAFVFSKRKGWRYLRNKSPDKETLMGNMVLAGEQDSDSEELESAIDLRSPLRTTKS